MNLLRDLNISENLATTLVCVLLGAIILNRYTRFSGLAGLLINGAVLFAGAESAALLTANMSLPLDYLIERTLLVTFAGMLVASFGMLLLFSRPRQG